MRVEITMSLDVEGIDEAGDYESDLTLHSLARAYFLRQYEDASDLSNDGLEAFEAAVLDTVQKDGIGEVAGELGNPIRVLGSHIVRLADEPAPP